MALISNINQCAQNDKFKPVPNPGLRIIPDQYQIRDRDSDLTLKQNQIQNRDSDLVINKTKSETKSETGS